MLPRCWPLRGGWWAILATRRSYDHDRLVKTYRIEPPEGWSSLDEYLGDLGRALDSIHGPLTHPVDQSLRHGGQTTRNLADYPDAAIRAVSRHRPLNPPSPGRDRRARPRL